MGFDARWGVLSAAAFGAPHERERLWIVATHPDRAQREGGRVSSGAHQEHANAWRYAGWEAAPELHRVDDGVAAGSHRLKAIGNGQVPIVAATAWRLLTE